MLNSQKGFGGASSTYQGDAGRDFEREISYPDYNGYFKKSDAERMGVLLNQIAPAFHDQEDEVSEKVPITFCGIFGL